jgi:hypothetical protein
VIDVGDLASRIVLGGESGDFDERMGGQDANGFDPRVSGSAYYCDADPVMCHQSFLVLPAGSV